MDNKSEGEHRFTPVINHHVTHAHENGLFHVLHDAYLDHQLSDIVDDGSCKAITSHQKERAQYLLFDMYITPVEFPIFSGYTLSNLHVRVDKLLTKEKEDLSIQRLDPNHITMVFMDKLGQTIRLHIYCNHMGNPVKSNPFDAYDHEGQPVELTALQKDFLYLQARQSIDLLRMLVTKKNSAQTDIRDRIEVLQSNLMQEDLMQHQEKSMLEALIELTQTKDRYSRYATKENNYYQQRLHALSAVPEVVSAVLDSEPKFEQRAVGANKKSHSPKKAKQKALTKPQREYLHQQKITQLIDVLLSTWSLDIIDDNQVMLWAVEHIDSLHVLDLLCLECTSQKSSVKAFIAQAWLRLPIQGSLFEYFSKHLFLLNTDIIRQLAPHMDDTCRLFDLYQDFLGLIESNKEPDQQLKRIEVAHVLHETSETYNQLLVSKQYKLSPVDEDQWVGVLAQMILADNIHAFTMYLEQGISVEHIQWLTHGIPYHALGSVLGFFSKGPSIFVFLDAILPYTNNMTSAHIEHVNLLPYNVAGAQFQRDKPGEYFYVSDGKKKAVVLKDLSKQTMTPLGFSIRQLQRQATLHARGAKLQCTHYPELILKLAQSTSPETLIQETMSLFEDTRFCTVYSNNNRSVEPLILSSRNAVFSLPNVDENPSLKTRLSICFTLVEPSEQVMTSDTLRAAAQILLTECIAVFKRNSAENQIIRIQNFYQLALIAMKKNNRTDFLSLTRATLFCCISMNKGHEQVHEIALKLMMLYMNMIEKHDASRGKAILQLAGSYFDGLSVEEQYELRRTVPKVITRIHALNDRHSFFEGATQAPSSSDSDAALSLANKIH